MFVAIFRDCTFDLSEIVPSSEIFSKNFSSLLSKTKACSPSFSYHSALTHIIEIGKR